MWAPESILIGTDEALLETQFYTEVFESVPLYSDLLFAGNSVCNPNMASATSVL